MRIIIIPIEAHVTNTLNAQVWFPVSLEEAQQWAKENPEEDYVVCPRLTFSNGEGVGIYYGHLVCSFGRVSDRATKFLVK